jgi:hypothetical protein
MMMTYVSLLVVIMAFILALTGCVTHKHPPMVCQTATSSLGMRALLCEAIRQEQVNPEEGPKVLKPDA